MTAAPGARRGREVDDRPAPGNGRTRVLVAIAVLSTILFVMLVAHLPVALLADAGHDDAWFWRHGASIASGHWMGGYDHMTLIKGAGYPLFLAVAHLLGLQVSVAQGLLHAGACLLFGMAVHRMSGRPRLALLVVLALQWHPAALAWSRLLRDNISAAQVLLLLACFLNFLFARRVGRRGRGWAAASGLALGWFWTTREDAIWILPGIALLLLGCGARAWRDPMELRRLASGSLLMFALFSGWLSLVAGVNLAKYGVFATVETRESAYGDAVAALHRVRVGEPVPYVPVPRAVRTAVYAVSPAFARLQPYFDGAGRHWTEPGCGPYPHTCGDYAGGWFMWAFRDAAVSNGVYASGATADAFFAQVADEVGRACQDGSLQCTSAAFSRVPPIADSQWRTLPARIRGALSLLFWQGIGDGETQSHAGSVNVTGMWEFLRKPMVPDPADTLGNRVSGWYHHPGNDWLQLRCATVPDASPVERQPSPDLVHHFADAGAAASRFMVVVPDMEACVLESTGGGGVVPLARAGAGGRMYTLGAGSLHLEALQTGIPPTAEAPMATRWIRYGIGLVFDGLLPLLAVAGVLAFAASSLYAVRRRRLDPLYLLAAAAWLLVAGRVALLVLVDLSAFPGFEVHYMQPVFALLVLAAIASITVQAQESGLLARVEPGGEPVAG